MHTSPLLQILDAARWAPSGDNTQPWRFELVDELRFVVHHHDEGHDRVYNLDGWPGRLALGALIETAAIAASEHGLRLSAEVHSADRRPLRINVSLDADPSLTPDPLVDCIPRRSVQRKPLSTRPLSGAEREALEACLPQGYTAFWLEGPALRRRTARLLFDSARIRLTMPEAYPVHVHAIEWRARFSADRVPSQALGVDPMTALTMRWAMHSWQRIEWLNHWAGGTVMPRVLMDWLPGVRCAAHLAILSDSPASSDAAQVAAGRAVQRFWLTATRLGLQHQPEMTPLIFARYAREGRHFSERTALLGEAAEINKRLDALLSGNAERALWFGRIGEGPAALARSQRKQLSELMRQQPSQAGRA